MLSTWYRIQERIGLFRGVLWYYELFVFRGVRHFFMDKKWLHFLHTIIGVRHFFMDKNGYSTFFTYDGIDH